MQLDNEMLDKLESWFETYNPHCMIYSPNIDEEEEDKMFDDYNELIENYSKVFFEEI
jgi:ribosomal protein S6